MTTVEEEIYRKWHRVRKGRTGETGWKKQAGAENTL